MADIVRFIGDTAGGIYVEDQTGSRKRVRITYDDGGKLGTAESTRDLEGKNVLETGGVGRVHVEDESGERYSVRRDKSGAWVKDREKNLLEQAAASARHVAGSLVAGGKLLAETAGVVEEGTHKADMEERQIAAVNSPQDTNVSIADTGSILSTVGGAAVSILPGVVAGNVVKGLKELKRSKSDLPDDNSVIKFSNTFENAKQADVVSGTTAAIGEKLEKAGLVPNLGKIAKEVTKKYFKGKAPNAETLAAMVAEMGTASVLGFNSVYERNIEKGEPHDVAISQAFKAGLAISAATGATGGGALKALFQPKGSGKIDKAGAEGAQEVIQEPAQQAIETHFSGDEQSGEELLTSAVAGGTAGFAVGAAIPDLSQRDRTDRQLLIEGMRGFYEGGGGIYDDLDTKTSEAAGLVEDLSQKMREGGIIPKFREKETIEKVKQIYTEAFRAVAETSLEDTTGAMEEFNEEMAYYESYLASEQTIEKFVEGDKEKIQFLQIFDARIKDLAIKVKGMNPAEKAEKIMADNKRKHTEAAKSAVLLKAQYEKAKRIGDTVAAQKALALLRDIDPSFEHNLMKIPTPFEDKGRQAGEQLQDIDNQVFQQEQAEAEAAEQQAAQEQQALLTADIQNNPLVETPPQPVPPKNLPPSKLVKKAGLKLGEEEKQAEAEPFPISTLVKKNQAQIAEEQEIINAIESGFSLKAVDIDNVERALSVPESATVAEATPEKRELVESQIQKVADSNKLKIDESNEPDELSESELDELLGEVGELPIRNKPTKKEGYFKAKEYAKTTNDYLIRYLPIEEKIYSGEATEEEKNDYVIARARMLRYKQAVQKKMDSITAQETDYHWSEETYKGLEVVVIDKDNEGENSGATFTYGAFSGIKDNDGDHIRILHGSDENNNDAYITTGSVAGGEKFTLIISGFDGTQSLKLALQESMIDFDGDILTKGDISDIQGLIQEFNKQETNTKPKQQQEVENDRQTISNTDSGGGTPAEAQEGRGGSGQNASENAEAEPTEQDLARIAEEETEKSEPVTYEIDELELTDLSDALEGIGIEELNKYSVEYYNGVSVIPESEAAGITSYPSGQEGYVFARFADEQKANIKEVETAAVQEPKEPAADVTDHKDFNLTIVKKGKNFTYGLLNNYGYERNLSIGILYGESDTDTAYMVAMNPNKMHQKAEDVHGEVDGNRKLFTNYYEGAEDEDDGDWGETIRLMRSPKQWYPVIISGYDSREEVDKALKNSGLSIGGQTEKTNIQDIKTEFDWRGFIFDHFIDYEDTKYFGDKKPEKTADKKTEEESKPEVDDAEKIYNFLKEQHKESPNKIFTAQEIADGTGLADIIEMRNVLKSQSKRDRIELIGDDGYRYRAKSAEKPNVERGTVATKRNEKVYLGWGVTPTAEKSARDPRKKIPSTALSVSKKIGLELFIRINGGAKAIELLGEGGESAKFKTRGRKGYKEIDFNGIDIMLPDDIEDYLREKTGDDTITMDTHRVEFSEISVIISEDGEIVKDTYIAIKLDKKKESKEDKELGVKELSDYAYNGIPFRKLINADWMNEKGLNKTVKLVMSQLGKFKGKYIDIKARELGIIWGWDNLVRINFDTVERYKDSNIIQQFILDNRSKIEAVSKQDEKKPNSYSMPIVSEGEGDMLTEIIKTLNSNGIELERAFREEYDKYINKMMSLFDAIVKGANTMQDVSNNYTDYVKKHGATDEYEIDNFLKYIEDNIEPTKRKSENGKMFSALKREGGAVELGKDGIPENITPQFLGEYFGLKGVDLGAHVHQQQQLNWTFLALSDLAEVLGVSKKVIGNFAGEKLSFYIAKKNKKRGVSAVYLSSSHAINLVGEFGDGSIAHEFGHAIDYGIIKDKWKNLFSDMAIGVRYYEDADKIYRENYTRSDSLRARSWRTDKKYNKNPLYYSTDVEMFARSFESYIENKMEERGMVNEYLISGNEHEPEVHPNEEQLPIYIKVFDKFFSNITYDDNGVATVNPINEYKKGDRVEILKEVGAVVKGSKGEEPDDDGESEVVVSRELSGGETSSVLGGESESNIDNNSSNEKVEQTEIEGNVSEQEVVSHETTETAPDNPADTSENIVKVDLPASILSSLQPNPAVMTQTEAFSVIQRTPIAESDIPADILKFGKEGKLSDIQVEFVTRAFMAFKQEVDLPEDEVAGLPRVYGAAKGHLIAMGMGGGKTRQAGAAASNFLANDKGAVWISQNPRLFETDDYKADIGLFGIGNEYKRVRFHNGKSQGKGGDGYENIGVNDGKAERLKGNEMLELPLTQLTGGGTKMKGGRTSIEKSPSANRLLNDILPPDYEGIIVIDESHLSSNIVGGSTGATVVYNLQYKFPKAKVLYMSGTPIKEPTALLSYTRFGIIQPLFGGIDSLESAIKNGGHILMELISQHLYSIGAMSQAALSLQGVSVHSSVTKLPETEKKLYNEMVDLFSDINQSVNRRELMDRTNKSLFTTNRLNFFNAFDTVMKAHDIAVKAVADIQAGKKPTIYISSTYETTINWAKGNADFNGLLPALLERLASSQRIFPTYQYKGDLTGGTPITITAAEGHGRSAFEKKGGVYYLLDESGKRKEEYTPPENAVMVNDAEILAPLYTDVDEKGVKIEDKRTLAQKQRIWRALAKADNLEYIEEFKERARKLDGTLPPADYIRTYIEKQTGGKVFELTGRKEFVHEKDGKFIIKNDETPIEKVAGIARFQDDTIPKSKRFVAVIYNRSGATGITLKSNSNSKGQRMFYNLEPGWNVVDTEQAMYRVHRNNQENAPVLFMAGTDTFMSERVLGAVEMKLADLGALSRAENKGTVDFGGGSLFDEPMSRAVRYYLSYVEGALNDFKRMGVVKYDTESVSDADDQLKQLDHADVAKRLLNALPALHLDEQEAMMKVILEQRQEIYERMKERGEIYSGAEKVQSGISGVVDVRLVWNKEIKNVGSKFNPFLKISEHEEKSQIKIAKLEVDKVSKRRETYAQLQERSEHRRKINLRMNLVNKGYGSLNMSEEGGNIIEMQSWKMEGDKLVPTDNFAVGSVVAKFVKDRKGNDVAKPFIEVLNAKTGVKSSWQYGSDRHQALETFGRDYDSVKKVGGRDFFWKIYNGDDFDKDWEGNASKLVRLTSQNYYLNGGLLPYYNRVVSATAGSIYNINDGRGNSFHGKKIDLKVKAFESEIKLLNEQSEIEESITKDENAGISYDLSKPIVLEGKDFREDTEGEAYVVKITPRDDGYYIITFEKSRYDFEFGIRQLDYVEILEDGANYEDRKTKNPLGVIHWIKLNTTVEKGEAQAPVKSVGLTLNMNSGKPRAVRDGGSFNLKGGTYEQQMNAIKAGAHPDGDHYITTKNPVKFGYPISNDNELVEENIKLFNRTGLTRLGYRMVRDSRTEGAYADHIKRVIGISTAINNGDVSAYIMHEAAEVSWKMMSALDRKRITKAAKKDWIKRFKPLIDASLEGREATEEEQVREAFAYAMQNVQERKTEIQNMPLIEKWLNLIKDLFKFITDANWREQTIMARVVRNGKYTMK